MAEGDKISKRNWLLVAILLTLLVGTALVIISCTSGLDLSDYPKLFEKEAMIVVGKNATQVELESAEAIAAKLQELAGNELSIKKDIALGKDDKVSFNLILIGTPNSNDILEQVYTLAHLTEVTREYPGANKGILEIAESPWHSGKALLIVAGSDELGIKAASEMCTEDEKIKELSGKLIVTEFADGDQFIAAGTLNSLMAYVKQNHPDAAPFIKEGISWTKSKVVVSVGYTQFVFTSDGWTVAIGHAITPEVIYDTRAEYNSEGIVWVGVIKGGVITERSYAKK